MWHTLALQKRLYEIQQYMLQYCYISHRFIERFSDCNQFLLFLVVAACPIFHICTNDFAATAKK